MGTRTLLFLSLAAATCCGASASHAATVLYLSAHGQGENASPVTPFETQEFVPGSGDAFHIWVLPTTHLTGISLNLDESGGAIRFTSAIVHNPVSGGDLRWLPGLIRHVTVSDAKITRLEAGALVGLANSGQGIAPGTAAGDALYEPSAGFLLATIHFAVVNPMATSDIVLTIGHNRVGDLQGIAADPIFLGPGDGPVANMAGSGGATSDMRWVAYAPRAGDFDANGAVDGADFLIWQRGFGLTGGATRSQGDANNDARVDGEDLAAWRSFFGFHAVAPVGIVVPESSTWLLILVAAWGLVATKRAAPDGPFWENGPRARSSLNF